MSLGRSTHLDVRPSLFKDGSPFLPSEDLGAFATAVEKDLVRCQKIDIMPLLYCTDSVYCTLL